MKTKIAIGISVVIAVLSALLSILQPSGDHNGLLKSFGVVRTEVQSN